MELWAGQPPHGIESTASRSKGGQVRARRQTFRDTHHKGGWGRKGIPGPQLLGGMGEGHPALPGEREPVLSAVLFTIMLNPKRAGREEVGLAVLKFGQVVCCLLSCLFVCSSRSFSMRCVPSSDSSQDSVFVLSNISPDIAVSLSSPLSLNIHYNTHTPIAMGGPSPGMAGGWNQAISLFSVSTA